MRRRDKGDEKSKRVARENYKGSQQRKSNRSRDDIVDAILKSDREVEKAAKGNV